MIKEVFGLAHLMGCTVMMERQLPALTVKRLKSNVNLLPIGGRIQLSEHRNQVSLVREVRSRVLIKTSFQAHRATNRFRSSTKWFEKRSVGQKKGLANCESLFLLSDLAVEQANVIYPDFSQLSPNQNSVSSN